PSPRADAVDLPDAPTQRQARPNDPPDLLIHGRRHRSSWEWHSRNWADKSGLALSLGPVSAGVRDGEVRLRPAASVRGSPTIDKVLRVRGNLSPQIGRGSPRQWPYSGAVDGTRATE